MAKVRSQGRCTVSQTDAAPRRELGSTSIICSCYSENVISRNTRIRNARHAAFHSCLETSQKSLCSTRSPQNPVLAWLVLEQRHRRASPTKILVLGCWKKVTAAWDFWSSHHSGLIIGGPPFQNTSSKSF